MLPDPGPAPSPAPLPLRCCLLSGGASRRMGRDKALLPHPEGGTWLERQLRLLAGLDAPLTVLSGWPGHLERAATWAVRHSDRGVELLLEPRREPLPDSAQGMPLPEQPESGPLSAKPPGPLVALEHLMDAHPNERLLLCPIDMPALTLAGLRALVGGASAAPDAIWIASPESPSVPTSSPARPQPLLGLYPSHARRSQSLREALARGERSLWRWLAGEEMRTIALPAAALANVNTPQELATWHATLTPPPDWPAPRCSL